MLADGELMHRARPSALVSKLDEDMGGAGAYRPPKLAAVSMEGRSGGGDGIHADSDEDLLAQAAGTATTNSLELSGVSDLWICFLSAGGHDGCVAPSGAGAVSQIYS